MRSNDDLIGQCLSNARQVFNEHIFFDGGGESRGTNGWQTSGIISVKCKHPPKPAVVAVRRGRGSPHVQILKSLRTR